MRQEKLHTGVTTSATEEMAFFLLPVEALLRVSSHARETQAKKKGLFFFYLKNILMHH